VNEHKVGTHRRSKDDSSVSDNGDSNRGRRVERNLRTPSTTSGDDCVMLNNVEENNAILQYHTEDD